MKIAIVGTGYVGLVSGACFADLGHHVTCIDSDAAKIALLKSGGCPIYEPGLEEVIARNIAAGRLHFAATPAEGAADAEISFIAVGTPASEIDGQADLSQIKSAVASLARAVRDNTIMVIKSTVPVGTVRNIAEQVTAFRPEAKIALASNPEFLRQGSAIEDFLKPDRIVIGVDSARAKQKLAELYMPLTEQGIPLLATTFESSEMIKYASNTMLAARIAFVNEIADLCEKVGGNIRDVAKGVGMDARIGDQFLQPGPGFGGSCFPKDAQALKGMADIVNVSAPLVDAVITSNLNRKRRMVDKIINACGGSVDGKTIAVLGLTFKPGTNDLRESVSLVIIPALLGAGAIVRCYDPQGMKDARNHLFSDIAYCTDAYDALSGSDCGVILTEWNEFKSLDLIRVRSVMKEPLIVDLRNIYRRRAMIMAGLRYVSIGRAEVSPDNPNVNDMLPQEDEAA